MGLLHATHAETPGFQLHQQTERRHLLDLTLRISKQPLVDPAGLLIMDTRLYNKVQNEKSPLPLLSLAYESNETCETATLSFTF